MMCTKNLIVTCWTEIFNGALGLQCKAWLIDDVRALLLCYVMCTLAAVSTETVWSMGHWRGEGSDLCFQKLRCSSPGTALKFNRTSELLTLHTFEGLCKHVARVSHNYKSKTVLARTEESSVYTCREVRLSYIIWPLCTQVLLKLSQMPIYSGSNAYLWWI